jgi:uncharacterized protein (DUF1330 family)
MPTFENQVYPTDPQQIAAMQEPGPDAPIYMVNLLKFKKKAEYRDGRESDLSGREAYQLYGQAVAKIIRDHGGHVVFAADVTLLALGKVDDLWDEVAIATYPNRGALLAMSTSDAWRAAAVHREAGLEGQLNIETTLMAGLAGVTLGAES